jgi:hypothetical protein
MTEEFGMGFLSPPATFGGNVLTGGLGLGFPVPPPVPPIPVSANSLLGLAGLKQFPPPAVVPPAYHQWFYVTRRFSQFLENIKITADQAEDGETKHKGVVASLNQAYWGSRQETANRILIGSWGKSARVRPPRDVDILFILPVEVYWQFQRRTGNRQSQLLQHMRNVLRVSYPATDIRGDRQVVVVPFNSYGIEVAPAFPCEGGGYLICDTISEGSYKHVDPYAEIAAFNAADVRCNGNVRKLTRILKQWQEYCDVPIKSFHLEEMVKETLPRYFYGGYSEFWFDWLVRDVLAHLISRVNGWFFMPVTGEQIFLGNAWFSKAQTAYQRALRACDYERDNYGILAGDEWQKIFGTMIPSLVS